MDLYVVPFANCLDLLLFTLGIYEPPRGSQLVANECLGTFGLPQALFMFFNSPQYFPSFLRLNESRKLKTETLEQQNRAWRGLILSKFSEGSLSWNWLSVSWSIPVEILPCSSRLSNILQHCRRRSGMPLLFRCRLSTMTSFPPSYRWGKRANPLYFFSLLLLLQTPIGLNVSITHCRHLMTTVCAWFILLPQNGEYISKAFATPRGTRTNSIRDFRIDPVGRFQRKKRRIPCLVVCLWMQEISNFAKWNWKGNFSTENAFLNGTFEDKWVVMNWARELNCLGMWW